jgi:hypothetical protein
VYRVNALDAGGASDEDLTENELRTPSIAEELAAFGPDLIHRWTGALYALSPRNRVPRATSARRTSSYHFYLDGSAPDSDVKWADPDCSLTGNGSRLARLKSATCCDGAESRLAS